MSESSLPSSPGKVSCPRIFMLNPSLYVLILPITLLPSQSSCVEKTPHRNLFIVKRCSWHKSNKRKRNNSLLVTIYSTDTNIFLIHSKSVTFMWNIWLVRFNPDQHNKWQTLNHVQFIINSLLSGFTLELFPCPWYNPLDGVYSPGFCFFLGEEPELWGIVWQSPDPPVWTSGDIFMVNLHCTFLLISLCFALISVSSLLLHGRRSYSQAFQGPLFSWCIPAYWRCQYGRFAVLH